MQLTPGLSASIISLLCLLDLSHAFEPTDCPEDGNPCAQAVTDTYRGPMFTAQAKADCSSFQEDTLYGHTIQTITVTIPPSATSTTTTTSSSTSESYHPEYTPSLPFSYSTCDFDPLNGGLLDLLGPNGQFIINRNGKAVEFSAREGDDDDVSGVGYRFYSPPNATTTASNVFDVIIPGSGGEKKTMYLAVFSSGTVGFVEHSSNGQAYVPSDGSDGGQGGQYVTTIWSVQCNGLATAGILGGIRFDFGIKDNGELAIGSYRAGRRRRSYLSKDRRQSLQQSVPGGFYIMPKAVIVPPVGTIPLGSGETCLSSEQQHVKRAEAEITDSPSTASQCGSEDWREYFVPKFDFEDECRFLHKCWATCTQTMTSCNEAFLSLLLGTCDSSVPGTTSSPSNSSSPLSSSPSHGVTDTTNLTACHNLAHFTHYHLSSTPHAFTVYASVYSQACVVAADDSTSSTSTSSTASTSNCALYGAPPGSGGSNSTSSNNSSSSSSSSTGAPDYYCSGTVSHPYMTSCPIGTSTSSTKKGITCIDLASDPEHCGHCNYQCPTGSKCVNGACSSPSCKGRGASTCGDWNSGMGAPCGSGSGEGNCMCVAAVKSMASMGGEDGGNGEGEREEEEEEGFCVDTAMPCKLLKECERNEQCFLGSVCVKGCCGKGVCVETDWCVAGGGDERLFGTVGGDTLGRKFNGRGLL
ncbi:hypothetical protein QBC45DRAFT_330097 [Copromyces sp. CBS 386.78]|nr:hypothetical protein QBC45DRAFT_330097 [Copromyces sp. CBS 386.78]